MQKGINLHIQDTRNDALKVLADSKLPPAVLCYIVKDIADTIYQINASETQKEKEAWAKEEKDDEKHDTDNA